MGFVTFSPFMRDVYSFMADAPCAFSYLQKHYNVSVYSVMRPSSLALLYDTNSLNASLYHTSSLLTPSPVNDYVMDLQLVFG